jgi:hypothetical protein
MSIKSTILIDLHKSGTQPEEGKSMIDLFSIHTHALNFGKWQPSEADKPCILDELHSYYIGTLNNCGLGEESAEALELYKKVRDNPILDCKDDIQGFFRNCYDAVQGHIDELYPKETVYLINLTICPE